MLRPVSFAYWALIALTCPVFFVGAVVVFVVTAAFDRRRVLLHLYSSAWATFYVAINPFWNVRVTGREHLPWRGPAVLVANHASLIDILVLFALFRPYKWVSKVENFKLPFVGWNMRLNGYVPLSRGDRASVTAMMTRCGELLEQGSPVLFFPEGTRAKTARPEAFKDGAFELALQHHAPVIPIAVHGTGRALPKHGMVLREHVDCHVEVLAPLDPSDHGDVPEIREAARQRIVAALASATSSE